MLIEAVDGKDVPLPKALQSTGTYAVNKLEFSADGTKLLGSFRSEGKNHGLAWYEIDLNWMGISTLRAFGLAWDIKLAKVKQPLPEETPDALAEEAVA